MQAETPNVSHSAVSAREIGQVFMAGLPGIALDGATEALIRECRIGNFILFRRNVEGPHQLWRLCRDLTGACARNGLPPPLIAIDQEGGPVTRLLPPFRQFPAAREVAEGPEPELRLWRNASLCAEELALVGINMNLAPVLDVSEAGQGLVMERRSLGGEPGRVARLGRAVIEALQSGGIAACGKHFPGLGAAAIDPHHRLPRIARTREEIEACDLMPFRAAISAGVAALMTSHTVYPALDGERAATLSPAILGSLLRRDLGFDGLLITDDLEMGAIDQTDLAVASALQAFAAGADILLICHEQSKVRAAASALDHALTAGRLPEEKLRASLRRIAAVKAGFPGGRTDEATVLARFIK